MSYWTFYRTDDGTIVGGCGGDEEDMQRSVPAGCSYIEGRYDYRCQKVEQTANGPAVVDYQPAAPANDALRTWSWDDGSKAWYPVPTFAANQAAVLARIDDSLSKWDLRVARPAGEIAQALATGQTPTSQSVSTLQNVNAAKDSLRTARAQAAAATTQAQLDAVTWTPAP